MVIFFQSKFILKIIQLSGNYKLILWLKNGKSKLVSDNLNYFKLKKFIVALESKTAIIEKLINNYLNISSDRGNDVQILF